MYLDCPPGQNLVNVYLLNMVKTSDIPDNTMAFAIGNMSYVTVVIDNFKVAGLHGNGIGFEALPLRNKWLAKVDQALRSGKMSLNRETTEVNVLSL